MIRGGKPHLPICLYGLDMILSAIKGNAELYYKQCCNNYILVGLTSVHEYIANVCFYEYIYTIANVILCNNEVKTFLFYIFFIFCFIRNV